MPKALNFTRYTFSKDHFRYFIAAENSTPDDPAWDQDGATGSFVFPPTDGVVRWRLPLSVEVIPGKEAGEIDVDVAWAHHEPAGIADMAVVASAFDLELPTGRIVVADSTGTEVTGHHFGSAQRVRVFVEVIDRDLSLAPGVRWGEKTAELHRVVGWPSPSPVRPWTSRELDEVARHTLRAYERDGIDPALGQREP